jgi:hypothetical protein
MNIWGPQSPKAKICFKFIFLCIVIVTSSQISSAKTIGGKSELAPESPPIGNSKTLSISSEALVTTPHCGTISSSQTWSSTDNVHLVTCNVIVAPGVTLTITEGTIVKFNSELSLTINGKLVASGTAGNPIYFTSYKDDTIGGDTNGGGSSFGARSDWENIVFNDSSDDTSIIDHAIIRFAGDAPPYGGPYGGLHLLSASPTLQNTEVTENQYCAISADMGSFPTLTGNNIHDNAANGFCLLGGGDVLVTPATWDITSTSYFLRNNVTVALGKSLTVNPGVIVKLDTEKSLIVNGKLVASGTADNPIYFTSYKDDTIGGDTNGGGSSFGARSDWENIVFNNSSDDTSIIDHAIIRFAGDAPPYGGPYGGLHLLSASPTLQNTEVTENQYCAISADMGSFPTLTGNNIHDNAANGFCLLGGDVLVTPATWDITSTSYFLRNNVTVAFGKSLTVNPGVIVKLDTEKSLIVNGKLVASGTVDNPIYFTSYKDDTIGGDTNGGGSGFGALSDWENIVFNDSSDDTSIIDHAIIRFAGDAPPYGGPYGGLHLVNASPKIQNATISDNKYAGISANSSQPILGCNNILNNSNYGIVNATPDILITAKNQWWGDPSGPYHPIKNPGGLGNAVSDGVDFVPWARQPCGSPTNIDVFIGGTKQDSYYVPPHSSLRTSFDGINNGPVEILNTTGNKIISSQRVIFAGVSYSEMMGLPLEQLTREYLFPYYNNVAMDSQLRISNVGGADTTITVYLGAQQIDSYTLAAGGATRKNYTGKNSGPLRVTSSASDILATIRVLYGSNSYSELMGLPVEQLAKEYLFPYYNNVAMDSQLRVSNVGGADTTITVYLGTTQIDSYTLAAGGATRKNYTGKNSGPLRVTSSASNILSTIRVLYNNNSYSELMGFPTSQLRQEYWYPVYDNTAVDSQLRVSNVGSATTHITVYAGTEQIDSYDLGKGAATRKNYPKNTGPLHVTSSTQPILTTIRTLYAGNSYYEMTGLPDSQLSTQYFFPWYNNKAMNSELRIAGP